ncbi:MAG: PAS domain S-box protein, partial [candidate division Zixibacteria bacterium]|nr:PAS domain S-box protein [candidate division Zixibacteria bacterium]
MNRGTGRTQILHRERSSYEYLLPVGAVVLLVILGLALYMVYVDARYMRRQLDGEFNQQQLILARQAASRISSDLRVVTDELERLDAFIRRGADPATVQFYMATCLEYARHLGVSEVGLYNAEGRPVTVVRPDTVDSAGRFPFPAQRLLEHCRSGELGSTWIEVGATGDSLVFGVMCEDVVAAGGQRLKLYVTLNLTALVRSSTAGVRVGQTGYGWVIDQDGRFLHHPEPGLTGRDAVQARAELDPGIRFDDINNLQRDKMLQGREGTGSYVSGWHGGVRGRTEKLIAFAPVQTPALGTGRLWSVAFASPIVEVARSVVEVRSRHFWVEIAVVAAMFGFALLVTLYQRRVSGALKQQVSRQEEYLTAILQNSVDAIIFIDNNNRIKMWNAGAEMIFGYTADEMIGHSFSLLVPGDMNIDRELGRIRDATYRDGHLINYQTHRMTKGGRRITVNISRTLIKDESGEPIGSAAIIKDVTEKVELDKNIYNAEKLASIGILASGVAHEINNPLAVILGFTDLLKERCDPASPEADDLRIIEENANHAKGIVENLLGFARISEGAADRVNVNEALDKVLAIVRSTLLNRKIRLVDDISGGLPPVQGDAREFQQVIFNLVNNAMAAMGERGGTLTVRAWADADSVRVQVSDTGVGIPTAIQG